MKIDSARDLTDLIAYLLEATAKITCTVYLRVECIPCMIRMLREELIEGCMEKHEHLLEEGGKDGTAQLLRQIVIWAKERTEEQLKEPCTMDKAKDVLSGLGLDIDGVTVLKL